MWKIRERRLRMADIGGGLLAFIFMNVTPMSPVQGKTLLVGPSQAFKLPSQAAAAAKAGDVVRIDPGAYADCAVWTASNLRIEGAGGHVVLTGKVCEGKAIFVVRADNTKISGLTFARAQSPDGNGAGIRAEGVNLTVDNSSFVDNQEGILAGDNPWSTIIVQNSQFERNGTCVSACAHAIYVNHIAALSVSHSRFFETHAGHHIKSRAARTEITDNHIEDGPNGTSSYLVDIPNGGSLIMINNTLEKGPQNQNHSAAVSIGEEGANQPTAEIEIIKNIIQDDGPPTSFIRNLTTTPARLTENTLKGNSVTPLTGAGTVN
jgi:hypothetical protein